MNRTAALIAALTVPACGPIIDEPPHEVWAPDRAEVPEAPVTDDLPISGADCDAELSRWRFAYDAAGDRVLAERFEGRGAAPQRTETRRFDDGGRIVGARAEWATGFVDVSLTRDESGRVVRRVVDAHDEQQHAVSELVERTPMREVLRHAGPVLLLEPFDPITERTPRARDRDDIHDPLIRGQVMIDALVRTIEAGQDFEVLFDPFEVIETRELDVMGRPVLYTWDLDGDGVAEQIERRSYAAVDDGGVEEVRDEDLDNDGQVDRRVVVRFDAAGRVVEEQRDGDADGRFETVETWEYDEAGALVEETAVSEREGARRVRYDRSAELTVTEVDEDGDGDIDHRTALHTRLDGKRVLKQEDNAADGVVDWQKRYVYDAAGRRVYDERDSNVDGRVDERWDYGYDAAGRLLHEVRTQPGSARCAGLRAE
ncbi:MAG: hypothetical protein R3F65_19825 [bacterium]